MEQNHQTYRARENIPGKEQICPSVAQVGERGPVIMPPSKIRIKFSTGALLSVLMCLLVLSPAKAVEPDQALKQSGLHYPDGYDPNTVGGLQGKVRSLLHPTGDSNLVIFDLETAWEKYAVIACPPWYWDEVKIKVSTGEEIRVIGSKALGNDSNLYIIAQEIHFVGQGRSVTLRNKAGTPLWDAHHGKTSLQQGSRDRIRRQR